MGYCGKNGDQGSKNKKGKDEERDGDCAVHLQRSRLTAPALAH